MRTKLTPTLIFLLIILTSHSHLVAGGLSPGTIDVSVLYRERIMVPPGSTVRVTLSDVSKMDVPATEISSVSQEISTGPPYRLNLDYDPEKILDRHRYSLKARIEHDGKLLFISTYAIDPFSSTKQPIEIITQKVAPQPLDAPAATLVNTHWRLLVARGTEIELRDGSKEPFFLLVEGQNQVRGFGGCNSFRGSYTQQNDSLEFSQIAATKKMCIDNMDQEQLFFSVLEATAANELSGDELHLYDGEKELLGSFQATYFQ
ncbi:MAG: YbaY family lipoprotein [Desulfocapsaceae bacterium]